MGELGNGLQLPSVVNLLANHDALLYLLHGSQFDLSAMFASLLVDGAECAPTEAAVAQPSLFYPHASPSRGSARPMDDVQSARIRDGRFELRVADEVGEETRRRGGHCGGAVRGGMTGIHHPGQRLPGGLGVVPITSSTDSRQSPDSLTPPVCLYVTSGRKGRPCATVGLNCCVVRGRGKKEKEQFRLAAVGVVLSTPPLATIRSTAKPRCGPAVNQLNTLRRFPASRFSTRGRLG